MLTIKDMEQADREAVLPMVKAFYHSDAVDHRVPERIVEQTFEDAVSGNFPLRGVKLMDGGQIVGFAYLSWFYACEVAGVTLMIEEIYVDSRCRGKGYGKEFFQWVFKEYPNAARFRLEVTDANEGAVRLYEKIGFQYMKYGQMIIDR